MADAERYPTAPVLENADGALQLAGLDLRSLFDHMPFAVQIYTPDGRLRYVNRAHREMWRGDAAESAPDVMATAGQTPAVAGRDAVHSARLRRRDRDDSADALRPGAWLRP